MIEGQGQSLERILRENAISPDTPDRFAVCDVVGGVDSRPLGDRGAEILFRALDEAAGQPIDHAGFFIGYGDGVVSPMPT